MLDVAATSLRDVERAERDVTRYSGAPLQTSI